MYALISNLLTIHCTITNTDYNPLQGVIININYVGTTNKEKDLNIEEVSYILDLMDENEKLFLTIQFDVFKFPPKLCVKTSTIKLISYKRENTESKNIQKEWIVSDNDQNNLLSFHMVPSNSYFSFFKPINTLSARAKIYCFNVLPLINQVKYFRKYLGIEGKTIRDSDFRFCVDFELVAEGMDNPTEIQMKVETKPFYFIGDKYNQTIGLITKL
ncbi:hypothetical protein CDIK_2532 [Cucumispora dikerogammari]|nr:hypothetical protein CDIK_2532 [Cucumispora dikerogammari]